MKLHVYEFHLKSNTPLRVGPNTVTERNGHVLIRADGKDVLGFGEASPLPFWSRETFDNTVSNLDELFENTSAAKVLLSRGLMSELRIKKLLRNLPPSLTWALENAFKTNPSSWSHTRVNGLISFESNKDIIEPIMEFEKQGFSSVKIKIEPEHLDYQADVLRELFGRTQRIKIRLDGNQSLDPQGLRILLRDQPHFRFDYIEEPLKPTAQLLVELKALQNEFKIPFAFDETLFQFKNLEADLNLMLRELKINKITSYFILKPMLLGRDTYSICKTLKKWDLQYIISSSYESPAGHFNNMALASSEQQLDMGLDLPELNIDWSKCVQKNGPHLRIHKEGVLEFCKHLTQVRNYELN